MTFVGRRCYRDFLQLSPLLHREGSCGGLLMIQGTEGVAAFAALTVMFLPRILFPGLSPKTLYEQVCEAFGRDTLVSSDKGCKHYQRFVRKGKMTGIILFRSLLGVASSDRKHQMVWPFVPRASVNKSIEGWINVYRKFLEWAPEFCEDYIFLSYEGLVADHVGVMTRLCERIGVQLDGAFPSGPLVAEYHNVLGNPSAHDSRKVCADESWKKRLTAEEQLCIRKHTTAQEIYKKMRKQAIA